MNKQNFVNDLWEWIVLHKDRALQPEPYKSDLFKYFLRIRKLSEFQGSNGRLLCDGIAESLIEYKEKSMNDEEFTDKAYEITNMFREWHYALIKK